MNYNVQLIIPAQPTVFGKLRMNGGRLCSKENIKVLQVSYALPYVLEVVIRGMVDIQVQIFPILLLPREQEGDRYEACQSGSIGGGSEGNRLTVIFFILFIFSTI